MSLRTAYVRKGGENTTKEEQLSPLRDKKTKESSDLARGSNSDYTAHDSIILVFTVS